CDSILPLNVRVDLAVDELQLIEIFDRLVSVENFEAAQLRESFRIQKSQLRGAVAHDESVFVMSEAPSVTWIVENRLGFEGRNVVHHADLVSEVSFDVLEEFTQVPRGRIPPPSRRQLEQPAAPLGQAFGEVAGIHCVLLNDLTSLQPNLSQ